MTDREQRHNPSPRPWYRRTWFAWLVAIVVAAIIVGLLVFPVAATNSVSYCSSCKAMKPAEASWAAGPHSKVSCISCHVPPGVVSATKWRLGEAKNVWADYLSMPTEAQRGSVPGNANCLKCHPLATIPNEQNGIRMDHGKHLELRGLKCADCHTTVSHARPGQPLGVQMVTCAMCHNSQGAPDRCDYCHVAPPKSQHAPDFMKDHGKKALLNEADCLRCHHDKKGFCDACHSNPPPSHYSGRWRYTHGHDATRDPANCAACHDKSFCAQCHSVNHPSSWLQSHGAIAAKGPSACLVCHPQSMCDECHQKEGVVTQ